MAPTQIQPSDSFPWDKLAFNLWVQKRDSSSASRMYTSAHTRPSYTRYPTHGYAKFTYSNGAWGDIEWVKEPYLKLHVGSGELHTACSSSDSLNSSLPACPQSLSTMAPQRSKD